MRYMIHPDGIRDLLERQRGVLHKFLDPFQTEHGPVFLRMGPVIFPEQFPQMVFGKREVRHDLLQGKPKTGVRIDRFFQLPDQNRNVLSGTPVENLGIFRQNAGQEQ